MFDESNLPPIVRMRLRAERKSYERRRRVARTIRMAELAYWCDKPAGETVIHRQQWEKALYDALLARWERLRGWRAKAGLVRTPKMPVLCRN